MVLTNMFLYPKCFTFLFQTDRSLSLARNQFFVSPVKLAQLPISHFQNFLPGWLGWMGWFGEKVEKVLGKCIATSFNET